jgi:ligand-binding SRPBCC domain-containing protein
MSPVHRLERTQWIPRPLEETFVFFSNASNLELITPKFLNFHIETTGRLEVRAGTLIDYRLRLYGIPLRWRTAIEEFEPMRRFVDVQLRGPYRLWRHTHEFAAENNGTRMTDRVDYQLPLGPLGSIAHSLFVHRTLERIFDYRRQRIEELLGGREERD